MNLIGCKKHRRKVKSEQEKFYLNGKFGMRQARYWICTIPESEWEPRLPESAQHVQGQLEEGEGGFRHYQCVVSFAQKKSLAQVRGVLPGRGHYEPSRSNAARAYCWKEDTRVGDQVDLY